MKSSDSYHLHGWILSSGGYCNYIIPTPAHLVNKANLKISIRSRHISSSTSWTA